MRVSVAAIGREGRKIPVKELWAGVPAAQALECEPSSITGSLELRMQGDRIDVKGALTVCFSRSCARCDEPVVLSLEAPVNLRYLPEPDDTDEEVELVSADLEAGWYSDAALELGQVVSEALALALPERILCHDLAACDARTQVLLSQANAGAEVAHPFAALKGLTL